MEIEIRSNDEAVISGYVNAVERNSKPLSLMGKRFVERVHSGAFREAIAEAKAENRSIPMLIDHDHSRKVADTGNGLELREDNIGLYAKATITDPTTITALAEKGAKGWSFGFNKIKDSFSGEGVEERTLEKIALTEVSLLIDKRPAYIATTVEVRGEEKVENEYRDIEESIEVRDLRAKPDIGYDIELMKKQVRLLKEM